MHFVTNYSSEASNLQAVTLRENDENVITLIFLSFFLLFVSFFLSFFDFRRHCAKYCSCRIQSNYLLNYWSVKGNIRDSH